MVYQQTFRPDLDLVYTRFGTEVSLAEIRRCAVDTFRDPLYRPGMRELVDFRATVTADAQLGFRTLNEIHELQATWIRNLRRGGRVVLVATADLIFGLCRIYASLAEQPDLPISCCRDWRAACRLLDLDPGVELAARSAEG
jgi:hypothetical protein